MRRDGFVLMAALWLSLGLSAVVLDLSLWVRTRIMANVAVIEGIQGGEAASAGIQRALTSLHTELIAAQPAIEHDPVRRFHLWRNTPGFGSSEPNYAVSIRDVAAALNINKAGATELRRFFQAIGYDPARSAELAESVIDWRDGDDMTSDGRSEAEGYVLAGRATAPPNGPFGAAEDVGMLVGVDNGDVSRILPFITTNGSGRVNINTAPAVVLASIPGISVETAHAVVELRDRSGPLPSIFAVANEITDTSRDSLLRAASRLSSALGAEATEVEVRSIGFNLAGRPVAAQVVTIARRGANVMVTSRRVE